MICQLATCEVLWSPAVVPTGDTGVVSIVSVNVKEAKQRIITIGRMLDCLGVHDERARVGDASMGVKRKTYADAIELDMGDRGQRAIRVFAASIAGVSGFTSIAAFCDEVAKWRDNETGANPGAEVITSLAPTMATVPQAVIMLSSSPVSDDDPHTVEFDKGNTPGQRVAYAPTWVANPTLSEEQTHADEPDEQMWEREYKAIPMRNVASAWFDAAALDACCVEGAM